jgi:hypothetical protein
MPGLDERADALYALPLDRFTAERDALAKALKADGDKDAAAEVGRLTKPTQAAWAVNAAVREDPKAAQALVEAARVLAAAQQELLGGGDPTALRAAAGRAREAVDALLDAAPAAGAAVEKVRATLHAATVDPEVLREVAAGRVLRERAASGFGGLDAVPDRPPRSREKARAKGSARSTTKAKAKDKTKAAKPSRDEHRRREKLRRAKEAEAQAEQELAGAQAALEQVESAVAQRRKGVRDAEARVKDARRRRERAEG